MTSFVGRRWAVTQVKQLLAASRLVTLTGVAGVGKTRLALQVARDLRRAYPDGVWLIELGRLADPQLVPHVVAEGLDLKEQTVASPVDVLLEALPDKRMLIVLDGCEHLLDEIGPLVLDVLAVAPEVRMLLTSREPLGIVGEHTWAVPPMSTRRSGRDGQNSEALALFEDRASAVLPGFSIGPDNEAQVARLCHQLDGLPLAIELAAVWMRSLSIEEIIDRLTDRYRLLIVGDRSALPHHQTLRAAIEWSFDWCSPVEQAVWARLSVFSGGFELEAAEDVCVEPDLGPEDVFAGVAGLVEKSVLLREDSPSSHARYRMLRTIRDYGRERLGADADERPLQRRHRDHYLRLAEQAEREAYGPRQVEWLIRLGLERDNLWAALEFCLTEPGEGRLGLRMATALRFFWVAGGVLQDGRHWLERALEVTPERTPERARALAASSLVSALLGKPRVARALLTRAETLARELGDSVVAAFAVHVDGTIELMRNDLDSAAPLLEKTLASELLGQDVFAAMSLPNLGMVSIFRGDTDHAVAVCERSRELCLQHGEQWVRSWTELVLGLARWRQGNPAAAVEHLQESLRLKQRFNDDLGILITLEMLAWSASSQRRPIRSARLFAAVSQLWRPVGTYLLGMEQFLRWHGECWARVQSVLRPEELRDATARGAALTQEEAIRYALGRHRTVSSGQVQAKLSRREREVADLVARGLSNQQIAERLVIAKRTSDSHIEHILTKLGFTSRAQIAAWVAEQGQHA